MHEAYRAPTAGARSRGPRRRRSIGGGLAPLIAALVGAFAGVACGSDGSGPTLIERDIFIDAYVDLRVAALQTDSQRIAHEDRVEILSRHGITDQDLLEFADANAGRLDFMRDVWNEVEVRLEGESMTEEQR